MASNIAVYYRFDTDDVINNTMRNAITGTYDATVSANSITRANYFIGKSALNIDANNAQYVTMPGSLTIPQSGFSISFWVASNSITNSFAPIFSFSNLLANFGVGKYALTMGVDNTNSSRLTLYHHYNSAVADGSVVSTVSVNDNIWRHVLITFNTSRVVSLYVNGKLNARSTFSNYPFSTTYGVSYIGRNTQSAPGYFTGSIDDFRIYSYAITSEDDINYLLYYPNHKIYTTSPSTPALLGNTISNFYDMNNRNVSQVYSPRTILPGTVLLVSGKPNQNFDTGDLTASSTTFVLPAYCVFDTLYSKLYVCDQGANELKHINMYSGVVNTIYTHTNVNSVEFDISGINYYLTGQSYIPQIDISTNTFQQNINTNALTNTVFGLFDNSNNLFISHATGIAKINVSGALPTATSTVITTTVQMEQMCFESSSQTDIYAIDASNTFIYVINKTTNANYRITLPPSLFTNNTTTNLSGLVFDSMDNLYVSCINGNSNIYMIPYYVINSISTNTTLTSSQIVLYAGTSSFGYSGDGGQCINAQFMAITNLSIDAGDNLYICDSGSYTIRKIINGGARKTNFMNMIANETNVVSRTASDLKTVYSGMYSIGGAGASASNYSNYCINNTSTVIETELQATSFNVIDNSGQLVYYKFNTMDTSGIQVSNYSVGMPVFDASMSDATLCSTNDYIIESGGLNMSPTSIGSWSIVGNLPRSSLLLQNNPSGFNYHGMSFGNWNDVAVSKNGLYVAGVGDYHNFYTNYNTNYNVFSQLYTVPTVELVGGTGTLGYSGDGGTVFRAQFTNTLGNFVFTPNGYYIANSYTIRFVNNQSIISTACGTNTASSTGNFGLATSATINFAHNVCQDVSRNYLYVCERVSNVVRRIDKNGIISPFCGTGTASSTGDGGPATLATLNNPWTIVIDSSNNVYILEDAGARIRMVDFSTNIITTLAGTGTPGFNDNVAGSSARFNRPLSAVLDGSRNLYVLEHQNQRIRKITSVNGVLSSSCIVTTICGTGTASLTGDGRLATLATLNFPLGLSINSDYSYLYIGQVGCIRAINMRSGIINRIFSTGTFTTYGGIQGNPLLATTPAMYENSTDPSNNIYFGTATTAGYVSRLTSLTSFPPFAKQPYDQVWALYGLSWKYISMSGTGQYQIAYMNNFGTYLSNNYGSINSWDYIADLSGIYTNSAALSYTGQYQSVMDVYGNIYVSTRYGVNSSWTQRFVNTRNTNFTPMPAKIACSFDGKYQVATAFRYQQVTKIAGTGTPGFSGDTGLATAAAFNYQPTCRFDSSNNMIFADGYNHRIRRIATRTGIITTIAGTGSAAFPAAGGTATAVTMAYPFGMMMDVSNNYYIASYHGLLKVTGTTLAILGGSNTGGTFAGDGAVLSTTTRFASPQGICCDSFNNIYISDGANRRLRKITATTNFVSTIAGNGTNSSTGDGGLATASTLNPGGICCDSFNNIYVLDTNRLRKIDALSGIITTICGTGVATSTGDGGPASSATISNPLQVCVDRANNLYISEYGNNTSGNGNRVRKITARNGELNGTCIVSTYAGNGTLTTGGDNGLPTAVGLGLCTSISIDNFDNYYFNNNNVCILYKATQFANVIVSSNYGQTWSDVTTNITGNISFNNVAVSQTGQYMTATSLNGRIYRSTNFGISGSWAVSNSTIDNWGSVVVSNTGQYQVAAGYDMGGFYSSDFGLNWTANGMPNGNWSSLALSESTNTLYAVSKNAGASGSTIYKNPAFNLPNSGLSSEWLTIHNPVLKSANWPTVNGLSFSFWCKSNNNASFTRFFDFGNGPASNNVFMGIVSNNIVISVYNGATENNQYSNIQINDNIWRHVCWTMRYTTPNATNSIHTVYINGVNVYQTFTYYPNATARQFCYIGRSNWVADAYFNGVIDDFRIYNRVLSDQEIFKLYSTNECVHYYKFDSDYDFTNTQLANYNTVKPTYDGRQNTKDPSPPIITTATTVSYGTYTLIQPNVNNIYGMALTQNNKRMMTIVRSGTFSFSDYNVNRLAWNTFTNISITSFLWTGIKTTADGYRVVMCAATSQTSYGGLHYSSWTGTSYSALTTINVSLPTTIQRFYGGIELTANGDRLITIADYVYFATWDNDTQNYINLTATTLAVGCSFITYDSSISQKYNMCGGIACNADGSRIAYANSNNEIYFATWNGTTYVNPVLIAVLDPYATGMTMSCDGNLLFYSNVSDFSQKIYYSIWNGTTYTVQTELSYNFITTSNSSPNDGLPQFTPAGTLYMALSYDLSTLYISTNSNSAYIDTVGARNTAGIIYIIPLTYTNTSAMTKKVGTNSLVVQRQNIINQPYLHSFTSSSAAATNSFTVGTIGANDISITSDKLRAVICGRTTGYIYVSTYNISTATWSALTAQTNQTAFTAGILISAKIRADGARGIAITNSAGSSCYFFTWNGSSYSAFTTTLGSTGTFVSCAITSNGSRIFVLKDGKIQYADWNGSNYGAWTNTDLTAVNAVACNGTGTVITYMLTTRILFVATFNGTSYVEQPVVATYGASISALKMNTNGTMIVIATASAVSLQRLSINYKSAGEVHTIVNVAGTYNGYEITADNATIYAVSYTVSAGTIYSSNLTLTYNNNSFIPYLTPPTQPLTVGTGTGTGNLGTLYVIAISATEDNSRIVVAAYWTGIVYYSTYDKTTGLYSRLTTTPCTPVSESLGAMKITADGSRMVIAYRTLGCYFSTWLPQQNNYSVGVVTLGGSSQLPSSLDMTSDGSRIFIISTNGVYYANWNGSNYSAWISIGIAGAAINSTYIGCSGDGMRIVYCNNSAVLFWALWNGYTYVVQSTTIGTVPNQIRHIRLSYDGSILFYTLYLNGSTSAIYSVWNGSRYSNAIFVPTAAIPASLDAWGLNISYDLTKIMVNHMVTTDGTVYQTTTDLKSPTQVSALTIPDTKQFIRSTPILSITKPFTTPIGNIGISITQNGLRAVIANQNTGFLYFSTFNGTVWSALTQTLASALANTIINVKITADGSRGVCITRGGTGFAYYFTWNGNNYSALTQTLGATSSTYQTIDMTADGSRIFTVDAAFVKYANWNGSNYSAWTNTSFVGSAVQTAAVGCSADGNKIVYCCNTTTLNYASWNGSAYVNVSTFGSVSLGNIRTIRFSYDGNYVFYTQSSALPNLFYSVWDGTTFGRSTSITVTGMASTNAYALAISYTNPYTIYIGSWSPSLTNEMYQVSNIIMQPYSLGFGNIGYSITQNGLRAIIANHNTGLFYFSTFNGSFWSSLTQTLSSALAFATLISVKITADGSRGVCIARGGSGLAYYFTWNGTNYSALTQTLGATSSTYQTIDMTADGSRIFTVDAAFVKYADWNGTNYSAWTNTSFVGSAIQTAAVGCSADGYRIVYCCNTTTLNYAAWNGSAYVNISTFGTVSLSNIRTIRFSFDGNYVFYSQVTAVPNVFYSVWNGATNTFGPSNSITITGMAATDPYPLAVTYDLTSLYVGSYSGSIFNQIYQVPLTLTTIAPNTTGLTFSFWVKSIASPDYGGLISLQSIYGWILMYLLGNTVYAAINEQRATLPSNIYPTSITKNAVAVATIQQYTWNHIAWTIQQVNTNYDVSGAGVWTVYLNGNSVYQNTNQIYPYPGTRTMNFVGHNGQSNVFMNGNMDDYRAYNRVLSPKEIQNIYVNSPNITYEKTASLPAGLQSEVGGTYTFSTGNAIPILTDYTTVYRDLSAVPIQNGAYVLSNSSNLNLYYLWNAFDNNPDTYYYSFSLYDNTTGVYTRFKFTKIQGVGDVSGEWQQIQIPYSLQVSSYIITIPPGIPERFPGTWYLVGSNNGADWYPIDYKSGITYTADTVTFTPNQSNTNYYYYFRFVWVIVGGTPYTVNRNSINLVAVQFSGAARFLNYFYYNNGVKTYIPRLQSNNFSNWRLAVDNTSKNWNNTAISNDGSLLGSVRTPSTVFRSVDYGITWAEFTSGATLSRQIAIAANGSNAVIGGDSATFIRYSINGGTTWATGTTASTHSFLVVAMNAAGTTTVFGSGGTSGNYYSTNGGQTSAASTGGLTVANNGIGISSSGIYALTTYNTATTIYRSINSGVAYSATSSISTTWGECVIEDTGLAFAFTLAGQLYRSTNFGVNWSTVSSHPVEGVSSISMSRSGQYILTSTPSRIYFSNDYGITFTLKSIIPYGSVSNIRISRDGRIGAVSSLNGKIFVARL